MNLYCIKCLNFTKSNDIKMEDKIGGKLIFIVTVLTVVLKSLKLLMKKK